MKTNTKPAANRLRHSLRLYILASLILFPLFSSADPSASYKDNNIEVYSDPGNNAYRSTFYRVEVYSGTRWINCYTYGFSRKSKTNFHNPLHRGIDPSVNFVTFGTLAGATIRISNISGPITSVDSSPKSQKNQPAILDGHAVLHLAPNEKVWIVVNKDAGNPLFVYADPPKPAVPPGATYFGPGIHEIGLGYKLKKGQTLYLDGGAWVIGTLDLRGSSDVRIIGPGVLSGEKWQGEDVSKIESKTLYHMVIGDGGTTSGHSRLEGITILDSPSYNMDGGISYIGGVKLLSPWFYSTDGFHLLARPGQPGLLEHCFAFIGDDVVFPRENHKGNIEVRDSFFSTTNNSVFQICYWGDDLTFETKAYVHDIFIKNYLPSWQSAVFRASIDKAQNTGAKNMTFENIVIEGNLTCPLVQIENREYFWPEQYKGPETKLGNTFNMVFRNISASFDPKTFTKSTLLGLNEQNGHHDYVFDDVKLNGVTLTQDNVNDYFTLNQFHWNIRFKKTVDPVRRGE